MSRILKALKAMSYYYGINFGICYAGDDCLYNNFASGSHRYFYDGNTDNDSSGAPTQTELQDVAKVIPYTLPATPMVRKYQSTSDGVKHDVNGNIIWEDGTNDQNIVYNSPTPWIRGMYAVANKQRESTCSRLDWYNTNLNGKTYRRIIYPGSDPDRDSNLYPAVLGSPMCKIVIQTGYLDSSRVISPEDLYTDAKYDKFHDMGGQYFAYKYFDFTDFDYEYNSWMEYTPVPNAHNSITLPGQNEISTPPGKTLSGWEVVKSGGNIPIGNGQYSPLESHAVNGVVTLAPVFVESTTGV